MQRHAIRELRWSRALGAAAPESAYIPVFLVGAQSQCRLVKYYLSIIHNQPGNGFVRRGGNANEYFDFSSIIPD